MSVSIAKAVVAGLRDFGVTVHESDGCYSRGNGYTSNYTGLIIHHTGSGYGRDYKTLYDGRPDLARPLCNTSGNTQGVGGLTADQITEAVKAAVPERLGDVFDRET